MKKYGFYSNRGEIELQDNPFPKNINKIIVDGSNIAFFSRNKNSQADFRNLQIIDSYLADKKVHFLIDYFIVCDSSLQYRISSKEQYIKWCKEAKIIQSPATIKADEFIVSLMLNYDGNLAVISNDLFKEYRQLNSLKWRIQYGFMILFNEIFMKQFIFNNPKKSVFNCID